MERGIERDTLAQALLRHLADNRDKDDPVGSFARTVLNGEATLREAAAFSWHGEGLAAAYAKGSEEFSRLSPEQRDTYEREAVRYRERLRGNPSTEAGVTR